MAHPSFEVGKFGVLGRFEIHFGRDSWGFWFYEIQDRETLVLVDGQDGLTEGEFFRAIGCALDPFQLLEFQRLVRSL
jgi:hypothetical protein